jgi:transcriptional regulator with XRE-family HTH domain
MSITDATTLGQRLRSVRLARNVSQESLARRAGVTRAAVIRIEHGQTATPRMGTIVALARALNVEPSWLLSTDADAPGGPLNAPGICRLVR